MREEIGRLLLAKLPDPRIEPALTSITRVEVQEDLLSAKVYVSVMGTEADQRRAVRALRHAAGHIQGLLMSRITLRHTPILDFQIDMRYKNTLQTLEIIDRAMDELRARSESPAAADDQSGGAGPGEPKPPASQSPARSQTGT